MIPQSFYDTHYWCDVCEKWLKNSTEECHWEGC